VRQTCASPAAQMPATANCAALRPASRPNVAPDMSPVPLGEIDGLEIRLRQ